MAKSSTKGRTPSGTLALTWGASTDPGRVRSVNQDSFFADPGRGLFIVSDGMGGEQAGALASEVVVKVLPAIIEQRLGQLKSNPPPTIRTQLRRAICDLSHRLRTESAAQIGLIGMGATAVVALLGRRSVHLAHLGDSRAYIFRQGRLVQLTHDHSVVGILLRQGEITHQQARSHPAQGRLSRFVGMEDEALPDVKTMRSCCQEKPKKPFRTSNEPSLPPRRLAPLTSSWATRCASWAVKMRPRRNFRRAKDGSKSNSGHNPTANTS